MPSTWTIAVLLVLLYLGWRVYRRSQRQAEPPPDGIVVLLAETREIGSAALARHLQEATGCAVSVGDEAASSDADKDDTPAGNIVIGDGPTRFIHLNGKLFLFHSMPAPYLDPENTTRLVNEGGCEI